MIELKLFPILSFLFPEFSFPNLATLKNRISHYGHLYANKLRFAVEPAVHEYIVRNFLKKGIVTFTVHISNNNMISLFIALNFF